MTMTPDPYPCPDHREWVHRLAREVNNIRLDHLDLGWSKATTGTHGLLHDALLEAYVQLRRASDILDQWTVEHKVNVALTPAEVEAVCAMANGDDMSDEALSATMAFATAIYNEYL